MIVSLVGRRRVERDDGVSSEFCALKPCVRKPCMCVWPHLRLCTPWTIFAYASFLPDDIAGCLVARECFAAAAPPLERQYWLPWRIMQLL